MASCLEQIGQKYVKHLWKIGEFEAIVLYEVVGFCKMISALRVDFPSPKTLSIPLLSRSVQGVCSSTS